MVRISIYDSISVLFHFLQFGQKTVFYQGNIIQLPKTFENYGITDNDRIVILPTNQITLATEQFWRKTTKQDIENKNQIDAFQNPFMKNHIAHQQDLIMSKIENQTEFYRKIIQNFQFLSNEPTLVQTRTNLNWAEKENPNDSSLPIIW
jgi:hypothetical protein